VPSPSSVHDQLTDILVAVVGCPAEDVVPSAALKKLGTDSLTIIEVGEELGRRFGVHLADDTINSLRTVQDAVDAIVRHDGSTVPPPRSPKSRSLL
jgi:acyl carrier protein